MLAKGERARRQLGALTGAMGTLGSVARHYYDYEQQGQGLQDTIDKDQARIGAQSEQAKGEAQTAGADFSDPPYSTGGVGGEPTAPGMASPRGTAPTISIADSGDADPSLGDRIGGGLSRVARSVLAPWGMMEDPERRALKQKAFKLDAQAEHGKRRDKIAQTMIPVAENPGAVAADAGYPEFQNVKRNPTLSRDTEWSLRERAVKGNAIAQQILDAHDKNVIAQRQAGRAPTDTSPKLSGGYSEDPAMRVITFPDGSTAEVPLDDLGGMQQRHAIKDWSAKHPDVQNPDIKQTVRPKTRRPLGPAGGAAFAPKGPAGAGWGDGMPAGATPVGGIEGYHLEDDGQHGFRMVPDDPNSPPPSMNVTMPTTTATTTMPPTTSTRPHPVTTTTEAPHEYGPRGLRLTD